jgi:hypothetical protein
MFLPLLPAAALAAVLQVQAVEAEHVPRMDLFSKSGVDGRGGTATCSANQRVQSLLKCMIRTAQCCAAVPALPGM